MITVELFNQRLTAKNNAKARKNKLLEHLIANFSNLDIKERNELHAREQSFLNKTTNPKNKKKTKKVKLPMKQQQTTAVLEGPTELKTPNGSWHKAQLNKQ